LAFCRFCGDEPLLFVTSDVCCIAVAEQLHCSLHVKELKVTKVELKKQVGDWTERLLNDCWVVQLLEGCWTATGRLEIQQSQPKKSEINEA